MKSLTPQHNQELGDVGEYGASIYYMDNDSSARIFNTSNNFFQNDSITALNKPLMGNRNVTEVESYHGKHPDSWDHLELLSWLKKVCDQRNLDYQMLRSCLESLTGSAVTIMQCINSDEFSKRFPREGSIVQEALVSHMQQLGCGVEEAHGGYPLPQTMDQTAYWENYPNNPNSNYHILNTVHFNNHNHSNHSNQTNYFINNNYENQCNFLDTPNIMEHADQRQSEIDSEGESNHSFINLYPQENLCTPNVEGAKLGRRKPGRPPIKDKKSKNGGQRNSRLWEFIRDLLLDESTCPSLLKWENVDEGVFRFVQSDKVAKLWGERKCNPRMTYEKLSRAMRTYYQNDILEPVPKSGKYPKKLVYKFGPASQFRGWKVLAQSGFAFQKSLA